MVIRCFIALALLTGTARAECPPECGPLEPVEEPPPTFAITGTVLDHARNPASGATVFAQRDGEAHSAITDDAGAYKLQLPAGTYKLTIYWFDITLEYVDVDVEGDQDRPIVLPRPPIQTITPIISPIEHSCLPKLEISQWQQSMPYVWSWPDLATQPRHGLHQTRGFVPIARDRTHRAWIAPVAGADPDRAVATVGHGHRFHGAPGIPVAFVDGVTTYTMRAPIDVATGAGGGSKVELRGGDNEIHGDAHLVLGSDRGAGMEMFVAAPLKRDKVWVAAGLVADPVRGGATGMARAHYVAGKRSSLSVAAIASEHDQWAAANWLSLFDDDKVEVRATVTAAHLEGSPVAALASVPLVPITDRVGGRATLRWNEVTRRVDGKPSHALVLMAEGGGGHRGEEVHSDATWAIGDEWQVRRNVAIHTGLRGHHRNFGDQRAHVVTPRVSISWDRSREQRSDLFLAYQRISHLDDGLPGDWIGAPIRFHDELVAGAAFQPRRRQWLSLGLSARVRWIGERDAEVGLDGWARWDRSFDTLIHAAATTLDRTATVHAWRRIIERPSNSVLAAVTGRVDPARGDAGVALKWLRSGEIRDSRRDPAFELSAEGYAGTAGPGARVLVGASW